MTDMPAPMPHLVATDLDGTIVRSDGTISSRTVRALERVERAGATLVLVTGRPPRWMAEIADAVGHHGLAICANGALVYDLSTESVVRSRYIEPDVLTEAIGRLREVVPEFRFAVEHGTGFVFEAHYNLGTWDFGGRPVDGDTLVSVPGSKLLAFHPDGNPDALMVQAEKAVGDLVSNEAPARSLVGILLACVSLVVMPLLSRAKRRVGTAMQSRAMHADAKQTEFCTYLSAILLGGLLLNTLWGLWWADPVAALVMVPIIAKEGIDGLRGDACCD